MFNDIKSEWGIFSVALWFAALCNPLGLAFSVTTILGLAPCEIDDIKTSFLYIYMCGTFVGLGTMYVTKDYINIYQDPKKPKLEIRLIGIYNLFYLLSSFAMFGISSFLGVQEAIKYADSCIFIG